jgi:molecular chaperone Hsp33
MTPLSTGEIDTDLQSFLERSDQVPTVLASDVLLDAEGRVWRSAGVLVQALPDGDRAELARIRRRLDAGGFAELLRAEAAPDALLAAAVPSAQRVEPDEPVVWSCPCSRERAENAVRLMGEPELARLVVEEQPVEIDCDFCRSHYELGVEDLATLLAEVTTARA